MKHIHTLHAIQNKLLFEDLAMNKQKLLTTVMCFALVFASGFNAYADDTEIFFGGTSASATGNPNILLILDTSGSMDTTLPTSLKDYNPSTTYPGTCSSSNIYYQKSSSTSTPTCTSTSSIAASNLYCTPASTAFSSSGKYSDNAIGWRKGSNNKWSWTASISSPTYITCQKDADSLYPLVGSTTTSTNQWGGTAGNNYYTSTNNPTYTSYAFYSANYVNYLNDPAQIIFTGTRLDAVKQASKSLIDSLSGVNVGIMRYSTTGAGGMVLAPLEDVTTYGTSLKSTIDSLSASGNTPLSETLYEAYLYYSGKSVLYGDSSSPVKSVAASRTGSSSSSHTYKTPITNSCQKNYVVFLTDGLANGDSGSDSSIESLDTSSTGCYASDTAMWTALGYSVPTETHSGGLCLKELSKQLNKLDLSTSLSDTQSVTTYYIGLGNDVAGGAPQAYLEDAGKAGGGAAEVATDATSLATAFDKTVGKVLETNATFTSPSIAVNAFNKTQILEDLYIAMFKPSKYTHWDGNLKKFKLRNDMIVGRGSTLTSVDTVSAVGANGFFTNEAKDFWQQLTDTDTDITTKGGAAHMIPPPNGTGSRNVYTYTGTNTPTSAQVLSANPFSTSNTALTDTVMGTGTSTSTCGTTCQAVINYMRGDESADGSGTDERYVMGDPIHSQPAVVIYGNDTSATTDVQKLNDAVVYTATNDGFLHAINVSDGTELWSYIPKEILPDLYNLYDDPVASTKHYSLDGDIRVLKYDVNGNGIVEPSNGDRVILYFSQGRGGDNYYAIDVTSKTNPKFLWSLDSSTLTKVNKSWSTPVLGRVNVSGKTQNNQKLVLIFAGGYDDTEDALGYLSGGDSYGNAIYIVDAIKGTLLWSAGDSLNASADLKLTKMTHAIPSSITTLDTDADGFTDRMYVGDVAGQLWRFDITNGNSSGSLVAGGVIASLGEKGKSTPTAGDIVDNRSFYNSADVSLIVQNGGDNFYNIGIGSGDRGMPKTNTTTQDYFFSVRDYRTRAMTQTQYNGLTPIKVDNLATISNTSSSSSSSSTSSSSSSGNYGWKLSLSTTEKSLADSITVDGVVMFTTYLPNSSSASCDPTSGTARVYAMNILDGGAYFSTLYETFATTGLPSQVTLLNSSRIVKTLEGETTSSSSASSDSSSSGGKTTSGTCLSGVTVLGQCVNFGARIKTFWRDDSAP
jgi:type IV pilus assembly protein PilY1